MSQKSMHQHRKTMETTTKPKEHATQPEKNQTASYTARANGTAAQGKSRMTTQKLVFLALLSAVGILLSSIEISLFPVAAPHLKFDPGDIPILIGAMQFGPGAGLVMSLLISFVQSFMVHGSGGIYGFIMHIIASGVMSVVAGLLYRRKSKAQRTRWHLIGVLAVASLAMVLSMVGANLLITPLYLKEMSRELIYKTIVPIVIPFNLLKALITSVGTFVLYRSLEKTKVFDRMT